MNEKNGIGESKPKQRRRQGESAPELPVGRAYAVEPLAVGKVVTFNWNLKYGWQLSDCGFCQYHLMAKSAIT